MAPEKPQHPLSSRSSSSDSDIDYGPQMKASSKKNTKQVARRNSAEKTKKNESQHKRIKLMSQSQATKSRSKSKDVDLFDEVFAFR
jgi:hypothetical protein